LAIDDNSHDEDELDGPENGEDEDCDPAEPSLGQRSIWSFALANLPYSSVTDLLEATNV
jgi:hypothetical protein